MTSDYDTSGVTFDPPAIRIDRLDEALTIITGLWDDGPFSFRGEHYEIDGLVGRPQPIQRPRPPVLVGGGGKRMLSVAARHADIVGLNITMVSGAIDASAGPTATATATDQKVAWVRAAAGDRFDHLELQVRIHLAMLSDDRPALAQSMGPAFGMTPDEAMESPHALAGSVDEIVEQCIARRERWGITYITISLDAMRDFAPVVERLTGR
jgi:probable F420-dependent oxidoreductase